MVFRVHRDPISLRQLEVFEAVARLGSITRAAEALHLTQPAVSIQMKGLAGAIGRPLTSAAGRGLRLTQAGRDLHETCMELAAVWSRFEARLDDESALRRGILRVSVVTTAKYFLPKALGLFVQRHPGIEVELEIQNRDGVMARLRDRMDDLYIMGEPPPGWAIDAVPFLDNPYVVVAPRAFQPPRARPALADLVKERFLLREPGSGTRMAIDAHLAQERIALEKRMVVGSNEAIKKAVAGGLGLAFLSLHTISEADLPELRILQVRGFPLHRAWHIVSWHDTRVSAPAQAFRAFLEEFAADLRGERTVAEGVGATSGPGAQDAARATVQRPGRRSPPAGSRRSAVSGRRSRPPG